MSDAVVITGIGLVTPVGIGRLNVWENLLAGRCGIGPVGSFATASYRVSRGAEIRDFDPAPSFEHLDPKEVGRASHFAVAAAREAFADAGLGRAAARPERSGIVLGTTSGEPREVERFNDHCLADDVAGIDGGFMTRYPCHVIAGHVAAELGLAGVNLTIPAACAAGNYAIGHAFDVLRAGRADVMLAGGSDAFSRITYTGFYRLGAVAPEWCQPFDRHRKGMVPGEGSAVLVLERRADALCRGARIYAEVVGYGLSCDAHHMTASAPGGEGAVRAMQRALESGGRRPEEVGYVSAHGTGTPTNDRLESAAMYRVFGDAARRLPTSSIKSMIGHTMGAASAIEAAVCSLAVAEGCVPPTIHFEEPDPECNVDCVPNEAREVPVELAMSNAYAFGGNNASVLFGRCSA